MTKAQKLQRNSLNYIRVERQNKIHSFLDNRKKKRTFISILKQNWGTKIDGNRSTRCKTTNDYNNNKNQNMWFSAGQTGSTRLNKANPSFDWSDKINQGDQGQPKVGNKARILDLRSLVILDLKGQVILHDGSQFVPWRVFWGFGQSDKIVQADKTSLTLVSSTMGVNLSHEGQFERWSRWSTKEISKSRARLESGHMFWEPGCWCGQRWPRCVFHIGGQNQLLHLHVTFYNFFYFCFSFFLHYLFFVSFLFYNICFLFLLLFLLSLFYYGPLAFTCFFLLLLQMDHDLICLEIFFFL